MHSLLLFLNISFKDRANLRTPYSIDHMREKGQTIHHEWPLWIFYTALSTVKSVTLAKGA